MSAASVGLTARSLMIGRNQEERRLRKYGDKATPKYFVYFLNDTNGDPVYIGRSVNPEDRLRTHRNNQDHPMGSINSSSWFSRVDHMDTIGPFPWDEAVAVEREEIGKHQPFGNRDLTARDHRPAVAASSQRIRDEYLASRNETAA